MEHPVPQDIASYEFHLVGDMTLKQFAYLATGLSLAYLTFVLFGQPYPFIAWPFIAIFGLTGTAFAFLPIMDRPLDHWVLAFVKAIFQPTKMTFKSKAVALDNPYFDKRLEVYLGLPLGSQAPTPKPVLAQSQVHLNDTPYPQILEKPGGHTYVPQQRPATPKAPTPLPSKEELKETVELAKEAQAVQAKILETEERLNKIKVNAAQPGSDPKFYTEDFQSVLADLQNLNKDANKISGELAQLAKTPTKTITSTSLKPVRPNIVPSLTLTSIPNIINGIVTDSQGSYLEGAIVVAHDKQGLPVRALKSNKLGQFIAATPLASGSYTITVEKEPLSFDNVQIDLNDKILPPLVMTAKRQERIVS
jgi:hypothetical protein